MAHIEWNKVTWYSKLLALIVLVVFPFVGFYWGIHYGEMLQVSRQGTSVSLTGSATQTEANSGQEYYGNPAEWQIYQSDTGRFTIAYPLDFPTNQNYSAALTTDWRANAQGPLGAIFFTLTVPPAFEPQTNFADAKLTVGSSHAQTAVAECLAPDATGRPISATSTVIINGIQFTVFKSADAGAGNYYETTSYRTLHSGQCYAVEYTVHSGQIANYPSEYNLKPFNDPEITSLLDRMAGTFNFL